MARESNLAWLGLACSVAEDSISVPQEAVPKYSAEGSAVRPEKQGEKRLSGFIPCLLPLQPANFISRVYLCMPSMYSLTLESTLQASQVASSCKACLSSPLPTGSECPGSEGDSLIRAASHPQSSACLPLHKFSFLKAPSFFSPDRL